MTIETKYNIGDEVWFQDHEQPLSREIVGIETEIYAKKSLVKYVFCEDGFAYEIYEQDLFPTKEELIKSL